MVVVVLSPWVVPQAVVGPAAPPRPRPRPRAGGARPLFQARCPVAVAHALPHAMAHAVAHAVARALAHADAVVPRAGAGGARGAG